jgi:hypothetical protein
MCQNLSTDSPWNAAKRQMSLIRVSERVEALTAVTMKHSVFWDVSSCTCLNRRLGGTYRLHLQGSKIREQVTSVSRWQPPAHAGYLLADFATIKMEAIRSSETSVRTRSTRHHILEDSILNTRKVIALEFYIYTLFLAYFSLFEKNKSRLMRYEICVCVCL